MIGTIPVRLKDKNEVVSLIVNVPVDYTVAQLLAELIEACELPFIDIEGKLWKRYVLQHKGETLPPHMSFGQSKIVRGDTITLAQVAGGNALHGLSRQPIGDNNPTLDDDDDYVTLGHSTVRERVALYWREARQYQAAGWLERALLVLLQEWQESVKRQQAIPVVPSRIRGTGSLASSARTSADKEVEKLTQEIKILFKRLVEQQREITSFSEFSNLLKAEATGLFFQAHQPFRVDLTVLLAKTSYELAREQRYSDARDFATLTLQIDEDYELANTLKILAQGYIDLQATSELEDKLELARMIYQIDQGYGNIAGELRNLNRQLREGALPLEPSRLRQPTPVDTQALLREAQLPPVARPPRLPPQYIPPQPPRRAWYLGWTPTLVLFGMVIMVMLIWILLGS